MEHCNNSRLNKETRAPVTDHRAHFCDERHPEKKTTAEQKDMNFLTGSEMLRWFREAENIPHRVARRIIEFV